MKLYMNRKNRNIVTAIFTLAIVGASFLPSECSATRVTLTYADVVGSDPEYNIDSACEDGASSGIPGNVCDWEFESAYADVGPLEITTAAHGYYHRNTTKSGDCTNNVTDLSVQMTATYTVETEWSIGGTAGGGLEGDSGWVDAAKATIEAEFTGSYSAKKSYSLTVGTTTNFKENACMYTRAWLKARILIDEKSQVKSVMTSKWRIDTEKALCDCASGWVETQSEDHVSTADHDYSELSQEKDATCWERVCNTKCCPGGTDAQEPAAPEFWDKDF